MSGDTSRKRKRQFFVWGVVLYREVQINLAEGGYDNGASRRNLRVYINTSWQKNYTITNEFFCHYPLVMLLTWSAVNEVRESTFSSTTDDVLSRHPGSELGLAFPSKSCTLETANIVQGHCLSCGSLRFWNLNWSKRFKKQGNATGSGGRSISEW